MYKVMIVDDEAIIRNGLASLIEDRKEFEVVGLAEDGETALKQASKWKPDLILADINMPFMNGLEFIEEVRKIQPDVIVVIITGYDNFEYIQTALRLGVKDYILKPIMEERFYELLDKMKEVLESQDKSRKYIAWAEEQIERNRSMLIESLFNRCVLGYIDDVEFEERLELLDIKIPENYAISMISLKDSGEDRGEESLVWDENLLCFACQNIVQEVLGDDIENICFRCQSGELAIILEALPMSVWEEKKEQIISLVEKHLRVRLTVSYVVGKKIDTISETFDTAKEELRAQLQYSETVVRMIECIEREYTNRDLSLQKIADEFDISPQYLSRLFRQETGETFVVYLSRTRLQKAMKMLKNTDKKVYEIAEKTGYATQHYFSSAFKKYLGMSPLEYRKKIL